MADDEQHTAWIAACDAARERAGIPIDKPGQCPLLVAEYAEIRCMWAVCDAAAYLFNVTCGAATASGMALYRQYITAIVKLVDAG